MRGLLGQRFTVGRGAIVVRLVGERPKAVAQDAQPRRLGIIRRARGAQIALLRLEAQLHDVHSLFSVPPDGLCSSVLTPKME